MSYEIGKTYIIHWRPTNYLYKRTSKLLKVTDTTLVFDSGDDECTFNVQKKYIQYIIEE